jgi:hypothetical protein
MTKGRGPALTENPHDEERELLDVGARLRLTDIRLSDIREHLGLTQAQAAKRRAACSPPRP